MSGKKLPARFGLHLQAAQFKFSNIEIQKNSQIRSHLLRRDNNIQATHPVSPRTSRCGAKPLLLLLVIRCREDGGRSRTEPKGWRVTQRVKGGVRLQSTGTGAGTVLYSVCTDAGLAGPLARSMLGHGSLLPPPAAQKMRDCLGLWSFVWSLRSSRMVDSPLCSVNAPFTRHPLVEHISISISMDHGVSQVTRDKRDSHPAPLTMTFVSSDSHHPISSPFPARGE